MRSDPRIRNVAEISRAPGPEAMTTDRFFRECFSPVAEISRHRYPGCLRAQLQRRSKT